MKKILVSLSIIGVVAALAIGGTVAYFRDVETSTGNTFTAGSIELKIDLQCEGINCGFPLKNLNQDVFFYKPYDCDIKPGDSSEVTISWHVDDNEAWGRLRFDDIQDWEYDCTEPEADIDPTCGTDPAGEGFGELSQNINFTVWMDEGSVPEWQCPDNHSCELDWEEGDNVLNGDETPIVDDKPMTEIISEGGVELPEELEPSTTYYLGLQWNIPLATGNIIQSDSLIASIVMEVVQSRNNPNPWN